MGVKGNNLTVKFKNGTTAVDHVSLQMEKGIYGLLGENGAGKTTLMRVLTTILKPAEGSVSLNGIEYCEKNYEKIQKKIGYLPQELNLYPESSCGLFQGQDRTVFHPCGGGSGCHLQPAGGDEKGPFSVCR